MANYFESGFTMLQELAKDKAKDKAEQNKKLEELKDVYDEKFRVCEDDKVCTRRLIDAYSDCD